MPIWMMRLMGLALCLNAASAGDEGGGGGGSGTGGAAGGGASAGAGGGASSTAAAPGPTFDAAKAQADAEAAALKKLGFDSAEAFEKDRKRREDEENARLTEAQRTKKLYDEALDARGKAEQRADTAKAEAKALREQLALRDTFDAAGVKPSERAFVEVALREDQAKAKAASKPHDEAAFFEQLKKDRPYFFGEGGGQPANTSLRSDTTGAGANGANNGGSLPAGLTFDAGKLPPDDWAKWRHQNGI